MGQLHNFVAAFVTCRFPTVLALNKADHPNHHNLAAELSKRRPADTVVSMAARVEGELLRWRRSGEVAYLSGTSEATWLGAGDPPRAFTECVDQLRKLGSTGVT